MRINVTDFVDGSLSLWFVMQMRGDEQRYQVNPFPTEPLLFLFELGAAHSQFCLFMILVRRFWLPLDNQTPFDVPPLMLQ